MMTIKDLKDILIHFTESKYDDFEVVLWDYNHQQDAEWGGMYSLHKPDKKLIFPIGVKNVDEITLNERIKKLMEENK